MKEESLEILADGDIKLTQVSQMIWIWSQVTEQPVGARHKDTANICKSRLKLCTISAYMRSAKEHHSIGRKFDRLPVFEMTGGGRIADYEGLKNVCGWSIQDRIDGTYVFD